MPWAMAASSPPPVKTNWPFLPLTMAVPVSWHDGQHAAGGDRRVLQQVEGHEAVVGRRLGVVEDVGAAGCRWPGPQQVGDVAHRLAGEQREDLGLDPQEPVAARLERRHAVGREQPVGRVVGAEGQQFLVGEVGHPTMLATRARPDKSPPFRPNLGRGAHRPASCPVSAGANVAAAPDRSSGIGGESA